VRRLEKRKFATFCICAIDGTLLTGRLSERLAPASIRNSRGFYKQRVELLFRKLFRIGWRRETV
jgi:hypothetical protein